MIEDFINKLSTYCSDFPNVENMYSDSFKESEITKNNLRLYLKKMYELKPEYLIVGEAPGYKGCRWSGVPFTSERNLKENNFFGLDNGFKIRNPENPESESSATIVWDCLDKMRVKPLIWNAFPFHPYKKGETNSNRSPTSKELKMGKFILEELIKIFNIEQTHIIPVGKNAEKNLKEYKILTCLRHPSHGGKYEFAKGMERIFNIPSSQNCL